MPLRKELKSILIIGSGPIIIGQACEFDYSGSQALRSLKEDGIETILINSNPATIMTDPVMADHIYVLPLTTKSIRKILSKHQIDAVLPTMGGQTALNLCIEADEKGIWKEFDIEIIGEGSHAAAPQNSKDPLLIASSLVSQIQYIVSRNVPPLDTCVISITQLHAGSAYNVIPETAQIAGTIRYFSDTIFDLTQKRLEEICNGFEICHSIKINLNIRKVFDVLVNDENLSKSYIEAAADVVGEENTNIEASPSTGSEDFADFLNVTPGAYCKLGHEGNVALHSPNFYLDPKSISTGSAILSRIIEKRMPI